MDVNSPRHPGGVIAVRSTQHCIWSLPDAHRDSREGAYMTPSEVLKFAADRGAKILDLRFMDFPGLWQHLSVPISELSESLFTDGHGFDGSSIRGWQAINASDMLVIPDPASARIDPFLKDAT